jgi:hypothetical protein
MVDRNTKLLLLIIAVALFGLLLRPAVTPIPAQAQDGASSGSGGMVVTERDVYLRTGTSIFRFERNLQPKDEAHLVSVNGNLKYVHRTP